MEKKQIKDFLIDTGGNPKLNNIPVDILILASNKTIKSVCDIRYIIDDSGASIDFICNWDSSSANLVGSKIFGKYNSQINSVTYDKVTRKLIIISVFKHKRCAKLTLSI